MNFWQSPTPDFEPVDYVRWGENKVNVNLDPTTLDSMALLGSPVVQTCVYHEIDSRDNFRIDNTKRLTNLYQATEVSISGLYGCFRLLPWQIDWNHSASFTSETVSQQWWQIKESQPSWQINRKFGNHGRLHWHKAFSHFFFLEVQNAEFS